MVKNKLLLKGVILVMVFVLLASGLSSALAMPVEQEGEPDPVWDTAALNVYVPSQEELDQLAAEGNFIPGEYIVSVEVKDGKAQMSANEMSSLAAEVGAQVASTSVAGNAYLLKFKDDAQGQAALKTLQSAKGVVYVEQNQVYSMPTPTVSTDKYGNSVVEDTAVLEDPKSMDSDDSHIGIYGNYSAEAYKPADPRRHDQWYLNKIQMEIGPPPAGTTPCVVVLDSGVQYSHPDLYSKTYLGLDFIDMDSDPMDNNGHGTHVAGIIGAISGNGVGITGVSGKSNIFAIRVLDDAGNGNSWTVSEGIKYANNTNASSCGWQAPKIYNLSLGGGYSYDVAAAITVANNLGRLVIAAAGNDNTSSTTLAYPAALPNTVAVAATEQNDYRTYFSNFDTASNIWIDIAAPGYYILSTVPTNALGYMNGTSQAAPVVSGIAARVWAKYPGFTAAQIQNRLISTADPAFGFSRGGIDRVNLYRALGFSDRTIQGRVFNPILSEGMDYIRVIVKRYATGVTICDVYTNDSGYYMCAGLPSIGKYGVSVQKPGYVTNQQAFYVGQRVFNANFALSAEEGTTGAFDWSITLQWPSYQPSTEVAHDLDLWAVTSGGVCDTQSAYSNSQSERITLQNADNLVFQIYAINWDNYGFPTNSRITGSGAQIRIYRNNWMMRFMNVPSTPTYDGSDHWYAINVNTINNQYLFVNNIMTDGAIPTCISTD